MNFGGGFTVTQVLLYNGYILHHLWHQQSPCLQLQVFPVLHIGLMDRNVVWKFLHWQFIFLYLSLLVTVSLALINLETTLLCSSSFFSLYHRTAVFKICVYFKKNLKEALWFIFPPQVPGSALFIYNLLVCSAVITQYIHPTKLSLILACK